MRIHRPQALLYLPPDTGTGLARLSGLEGLARSLIVGTVPLIAFERLSSKAAVSNAFAIGAVLTLLVTLNLGRLEALVKRRWVMTIGICSLFAAALLFTIDAAPTFVIGIGLRSAAASTFSLVLTLYVMDFIGKNDLTRLESNRMVYNGVGWLIGPLLGTWLAGAVDVAAPFLLSAGISVIVLAYYWYLRLGHSDVITEPKSVAPSPLANIGHFVKQKRMRVAYTITFVRSTFWVGLFVYAPIYTVEAGLADWVAGAFLSGVAGLLLAGPIVRRVAESVGTRRVIIVGYGAIVVSLLALASLGDPRPAGLLLWFAAAVGGSFIDIVGNIPFMRMVRPRERIAMATVFSTWRELSALVSPLLGSLVLAASAPFEVYYVVLAVLCAATAGVTTLLPKRL
ncbi:MAG: MFS transporter [Acidimicrobiales bacterium]